MSDSVLDQRVRARPRQCPHCESVYIARSRRQGIWGLPLVRLLRIHIYRCTECWRRFHGVGSS
jgi:DNA-directed RNA polymerase subunit RPC12/RpoP